jgi:hypothetical protein
MTTLAQLIAQYPGERKDDYPEIANWLNAPTTIDNPLAGETVTTETPTPITLDDVMALVPPAESAALYARMGTLIQNLQQAIDAGNRQWLGYLLATAADPVNGAISAETAADLAPLLAATTTTTTTQPDTIPGPSLASAAGLGTITSTMVQEAMNT